VTSIGDIGVVGDGVSYRNVLSASYMLYRIKTSSSRRGSDKYINVTSWRINRAGAARCALTIHPLSSLATCSSLLSSTRLLRVDYQAAMAMATADRRK